VVSLIPFQSLLWNTFLFTILFLIFFFTDWHSDRGGDSWRADSSGNEGNAQNTDPEAPSSDPQNTSPPKDSAQASGDKRKTIFRTTSNTPSSATKKKQSLSFSTDPKTIPLDACLSPTNVEPRKSLLEQLSRTFATDETTLPEVVSILGPSEPGNLFIHRLITLLSSNNHPMFQAHNTAEIKAILQSLMTKISK
jgi:phosphofurin acidic cluster sorting protein 2